MGFPPTPGFIQINFDPALRMSPRELDELMDRVRTELGDTFASERKVYQAEIQRLNDIIAKVRKSASVYATVLKVTRDRIVLLAMGKRVEAEKPDDMDCRPGDTVRVTGDTLQILGVVDDDLRSGEILALKAVLAPGDRGEIERAGSARAIGLPFAAEPGDRVIVDDSGTLALANLGPPPNDCAFGESTGVRWGDIGGLELAKTHLREAIEGPFRNRDIFARFGKRPTRGVLLHGPPGCGKTMLGKAAATAIADLHGAAAAAGGFYYVKGPELLNMYVGNTEANIRRMFDDARRHRKKHGFPAVIFLDEADAVLGKRGGVGGQSYGMERTTVPQFLSEMDGLEDTGAIVLLATNRPDTLDPAVIRDGRVDRRIHVTRPTRSEAGAIALRALVSKPTPELGPDLLAARIVDRVFSPSLVLAKVYRKSRGDLSEKLTLAHTVSGALVAGVVERATSHAMLRCADLLEDEDVDVAVAQAFNESLHVNHDEELLELCESLGVYDVDRIRPGAPVPESFFAAESLGRASMSPS